MANEFLFEQVCPFCGRPLLNHGHSPCYGPTIVQMHESLKINLARAEILDTIPIEG